jgi:hypothetical protein
MLLVAGDLFLDWWALLLLLLLLGYDCYRTDTP